MLSFKNIKDIEKRINMLDKKYDHKQVEENKYEEWKEAGYFE